MTLLLSSLLFWPQDLSSPTRDQTWAPAVGARSPNHCTSREVPRFPRLCVGRTLHQQCSPNFPMFLRGPRLFSELQTHIYFTRIGTCVSYCFCRCNQLRAKFSIFLQTASLFSIMLTFSQSYAINLKPLISS